MWEIVLFIACALLSLGSLGVIVLAWLYWEAKADRRATFVETGGFKVVVAGESCLRILDNLPEGQRVCQDGFVRTNPSADNPNQNERPARKPGWLEQSRLGIFWVSWFYPLRRLFEFEVVADKMKEQRERTGQELKDWVITARKSTRYLRERFPHPIYIENVELGKDRWKVNLIVILDIQVVNPRMFLFDYKGRTLEFSDPDVRSAIIQYLNGEQFDYKTFIQTDMGKESEFEGKVKALNKTLIKRFGIEIKEARVESVELGRDQRDLDEVAKKLEKERLLAEARKATAVGEREAKIENAAGDRAAARELRAGIAEGWELQLGALQRGGLSSADHKEAILLEEVRMSNLAASNVAQYVEGNKGSKDDRTVAIQI